MTTTDSVAAEDVEAFRTASAFAEVAAAWRSLWRQAEDVPPFVSYEWHAAWWEALREGRPEILLAGTRSRPRALAPLVRRDDGTLIFSGGGLADALDFLPAKDAAAFAPYLARAADQIELNWVPEGSPTLERLSATLRRAGFAVEVDRLVVSPFVPLPRSFEDLVAALGRKDRHELRRKLRRLEAAGRVEFSAVAPDGLGDALDRFARWHRGAPGEKGAFLTTGRERFFRALARAGDAAGWLRFCELRLDDRPIAALFGVERDGVLAAYNSAVDPCATSLSPGVLLHAYAMRDAIARGLRVYDLLRGDEPYKYDLGARDRWLWRLGARRRA